MRYRNIKYIKFKGCEVVLSAQFSLTNPRNANSVYCFSITGDAEVVRGKQDLYRKGDIIWGGACHDKIYKYFPELRPFIPLHLADEFGRPSYHVQNFIYHIRHHVADTDLMNWYRCDLETLKKLKIAATNEPYFRYLLRTTGLMDKWRQEAEAAIAWLEQTGQKFQHSSDPEMTVFGSDWMQEMAAREAAGEFTEQALLAAEKHRIDTWRNKQCVKINDEFENKLAFIKKEQELHTWAVQHTPTDNFSFFAYRPDNSFKMIINARSYEPLITQQEFYAWLETVDVPADLTVTLGEK